MAFRSRKKDKSPPKEAGPTSPRAKAPAKAPPPYKASEAAELVEGTVFDKSELPALADMYKRYTTDAARSIPVERMRDIPETSVFPLFQRVAQLHNTDNSGFIEFGEFVKAMSSLSPRATLDEKLHFVFDLYDMNQTGRLESLELFQLLRMMLGLMHDDNDLQSITETYLKRFPNGMNYEAFVQMFDVSDLNKLTLSLPEGRGR